MLKCILNIRNFLKLKTVNQLVIEGRIYLIKIKGIYDKPTANVILHGGVLKYFSKNRKQTRVPTLVTSIQHRTGSLRQTQARRNKGIKLEKE